MAQFIVMYRPSHCEVIDKNQPEFNPYLCAAYEEGLDRAKHLGILKSRGIFGWNNNFWGCVEAETAAEALTKFFEEWAAQDKEEREK